MWGCKQASCVSEENKTSVCCCQTVCHRRKILPWLLQPNHCCPHREKGMTAVSQRFRKVGQSIQSCCARMGCCVSLILSLSAPLSVSVQALKEGQWVQTPCAVFWFLNGWVPDGPVTPEHMCRSWTSGTAFPTESIVWSPWELGKVVHAALLHKKVDFTTTCHCSSELSSAAETAHVSLGKWRAGECHGSNYKRAHLFQVWKGTESFLSSNMFGLCAFTGNQA